MFYDGEIVEEYFTDLMVDDKVIFKIKPVRNLAQENEAWLLNHLKAPDKEAMLYWILVLNQRLSEKSSIILENKICANRH